MPAVDQSYTRGLTLYQHTVISRYVRDQLKRNVNAFSLARAKREIQEIVEREWAAGKSKSRTRKRLARYRGEGIQKRDGIEQQLPAAEVAAPRVIGPSKPHLMLQAAPESLVDRTSDFAAEKSSTVDPPKDGHITDLRLVDPEVAKAPSNGNGAGTSDKKSKKSAKKTKSKTDSPAPLPVSDKNIAPSPSLTEDLDMTGWSGDYNLPK